MCVLNSSMDAVQKTLAEEEIERTERFRADRKKRFYEEYANDQLTRIITSLMVQNHKTLQRMSRSIDAAPEGEKYDELIQA